MTLLHQDEERRKNFGHRTAYQWRFCDHVVVDVRSPFHTNSSLLVDFRSPATSTALPTDPLQTRTTTILPHVFPGGVAQR